MKQAENFLQHVDLRLVTFILISLTKYSGFIN